MGLWDKFLDIITGTGVSAEEKPGVSTVNGAPETTKASRWNYMSPPDSASVAPGLRYDGSLSDTMEENRAFGGFGGFGLSDGAFLASQTFYAPPGSIIPPPNALTYWKDHGFDTKALSKASPTKLLEVLADVSPDVSRALWDFLRFAISGYEIKAYNVGTKTPNKKAQTQLDIITAAIGKRHGTIDILFGEFFMSAFVRGAFFSERVFADDNRTLIDIVAPDPATVRFMKVKDIVTGADVFQLGQLNIQQQFVPLDTDRVIYLPVDKFPGSPYGRSPIAPAVFSVLFLISLMNDIKRVISQQGYPRLDIEVDMKELAQILPAETLENPEVFQRWVNAAINDVKKAYAKLQPESAFVHTSIIKLHQNTGTLDINSLGMIGSIISNLESMAMKALKSMPLLLGAAEGVAESTANRQWEVYVSSVQMVQHGCENMMQSHLEAALQAIGVLADVKVRFAELRASELLRDQMVLQLTISNAISAYAYGAVDFKTMVHSITGEEPPAGVTEPLFVPRTFVAFNAANAALNVNTTEDPNSATPDQAGGTDATTDPTAAEPATTKNATNDTGELVTRTIEDRMRVQVLTAAGWSSNGTH